MSGKLQVSHKIKNSESRNAILRRHTHLKEKKDKNSIISSD